VGVGPLGNLNREKYTLRKGKEIRRRGGYCRRLVKHIKIVTLAHCVWYQMSYTGPLAMVSNELHWPIGYGIKWVTLAHWVWYQMSYTGPLVMAWKELHWQLRYPLGMVSIIWNVQECQEILIWLFCNFVNNISLYFFFHRGDISAACLLKKTIIPLRLDSVAWPPAGPIDVFSTLSCIDWPNRHQIWDYAFNKQTSVLFKQLIDSKVVPHPSCPTAENKWEDM